jgi:RNA polymerase sigma-70 factor (ECF subfamily)
MVILAASLALSVAIVAGNEKQGGVAAARPSVVKTVPQCGDTQVDPQTRKISVTFGKEMMDKSWSWCTADEGEYPETVGQPKYLADKKTCIIEVKLKPKTTYAIWLNTDKFNNFKDKDGRPAVPYLLVFETK